MPEEQGPQYGNREDELRSQIGEAQKVKAMSEHPGWQEVIKPHLIGRAAQSVRQLLTVKPEELVPVQATAAAYNDLLNLVDGVIKAGELAQEKLEELKGE